MAITVSNKYSDVAGKVPESTALGVAQIAVNTSDGILYVKRPNGTIIELYLKKADLDSPVFVGIPHAPTQTPTSNSTALATTAFVQGHVGAINAMIAELDARITLLGG